MKTCIIHCARDNRAALYAGRFKILLACNVLAILCATHAGAYSVAELRWPTDSTIVMQLELGAANVTLRDGSGTWDNSAATALAEWNEHLDFVKFAWVSGSQAPIGPQNGYNSASFSSTVYGEGFGSDTLAVTVAWHRPDDVYLISEADVVFNSAQRFDSYRGPLIRDRYDFHRVALHEFGHVLGLGHVNNDPPGQALMEPNISNLDHIAPDDIAGVVLMYGYRITSPTYYSSYVQGVAALFTIVANNSPTSFSASGLPPGLQLDSTSGNVRGTFTQAGTFNVTVTAYGSPRNVIGTLVMEVTTAQLIGDVQPVGTTGTYLSYQIPATNAPVSFSARNVPPGLSLNTRTGVISGIPTVSGYYPMPVVVHGAQYDIGGNVTFGIGQARRTPVKTLPPAGDVIRVITDPKRDRLYVLCGQGGGLYVYDTKALSLLKYISFQEFVGGAPGEMAMSIDGSRLWLLTSALHAISLTDFSALPDIPGAPVVGYRVKEGANHQLYITAYGGVYQIDESSGASTWLAPPTGFWSPNVIIDVSPDGTQLFAADASSSPTAIIRYDIRGAHPVIQEQLSVPDYVASLSVSPDGQLFAFAVAAATALPVKIVPAHNLSARPIELQGDTARDLLFGNTSAWAVAPVAADEFGTQAFVLFSTSTGLPFDKWVPLHSGRIAIDRTGTYAFVLSFEEYALDVYPLVRKATQPQPSPAPQSLLNVSTRSLVGLDDEALIGGFIITGSGPKKMAVRALGASLPVAQHLSDPFFNIYKSDGTLVATNDDWNRNRDELVDTGLDPWNQHDAGIIQSLAPGSYTAVVGVQSGTSGNGLLELYDLSADNSAHIANLSTRGRVGVGDDVLIGGFIIGGAGRATVLLRALGPSLSALNVDRVLLDPILELHNSNGAQIGLNDDWQSSQEAQITATKIPPPDPREASIVASLAPGSYTAIVRGKNDTTGIALVEIYNLSTSTAK